MILYITQILTGMFPIFKYLNNDTLYYKTVKNIMSYCFIIQYMYLQYIIIYFKQNIINPISRNPGILEIVFLLLDLIVITESILHEYRHFFVRGYPKLN